MSLNKQRHGNEKPLKTSSHIYIYTSRTPPTLRFYEIIPSCTTNPHEPSRPTFIHTYLTHIQPHPTNSNNQLKNHVPPRRHQSTQQLPTTHHHFRSSPLRSVHHPQRKARIWLGAGNRAQWGEIRCCAVWGWSIGRRPGRRGGENEGGRCFWGCAAAGL